MSRSSSFEDKRMLLSKNGFYLSTPEGNSMLPFVRGRKDSVVILPAREKIRRLDAILYERADGSHVLHRVIARKGVCYIVRGDNCYYKERVMPEQIIGVLAKVYRNGKKEKDVKAVGYRFAVSLWNIIYPLRFAGQVSLRILRRMKRFLIGKK